MWPYLKMFHCNGFLTPQEESRLLDFHYSNLEFACGATLDKVGFETSAD